MSWKLYSGYRLAEGADGFAFSREARALLAPAQRRLYDREVVERAVELVDLAAAGLGEAAKLPLSAATSRCAEERKEYDPHGFSASIGDDPRTGRLYAILHTTSATLTSLWETLAVEEFGYWDNSEGPDDIPHDEFRARRTVWDRVLGPAGVPAESMLSLRLNASYMINGPISDDTIAELIPPAEHRARRVARCYLHREALIDIRPEPGEGHNPLGARRLDWIADRIDAETARRADDLVDLTPAVILGWNRAQARLEQ